MIPYGRQNIDDADIEEVAKVLRSDLITTGPKVREFEEALCDRVGAKHATVISSGSSALDIAVRALDLPRGSEVITTPFTFVATANSILHNNLQPVFADIEPGTRNIDPESVRKNITKNTKAVIYVDYAGHPCRMNEMREIADQHGLHLIEDACHALGAEYRGRKVGTFADMTIFSFHPVKHITTGEGGAVMTDSEDLDGRLKMLRHHGITKETPEGLEKGLDYVYDVSALSHNYRITDLQCALGISQLAKLESFIDERTRLAKMYQETLPGIEYVEPPEVDGDVKHAWHLFTVLVNGKDRNGLFKYLRGHGIGAHVHYIPTYRFTYYRGRFKLSPKDFPVTEDVFQRILTLPLHPSLEEKDVRFICDKLAAYDKKEP
ncbi:MAG: UDP-4-amino-4,6-dideoxy-N-acetyl-beta-L-altrosamine transaminase [Candidatus Thermoplasmatota archaeon]|nr:UDP-4-amino-4,6-dideoxy-N-acetyl-beta-L-altrosamine transaminase [Candidatus Thermoplasmatota archaeon]